MNLRFLDTYNEIPVEYMFSDAQYAPFEGYQEQAFRRCMYENDQNYFLNEMNQQVKKEEDNYFVEQNYMEPVQVPTLMDCLAVTLKLPLQAIQQISQSNPIAFHKLVDKAKRVIRREKAKLRCKLRQNPDEQPKQETITELKLEELSQEIPPVQEEKSRKKNKSVKKNVLGKRKAEKLAKLDESMNTHSDNDAPLSHVSSEISTENEKHQKKMVQMIRNRISAQNSRDRKKAYIQQLEANSNMYYKQNLQLQQKLKDMQEQNDNTAKQNASLKKQLEENLKTKKTSFKQMGLTLLTLVSVYLMMGQETNIIESKTTPYKYTNLVPDFSVAEPTIVKKLQLEEPRTNLTEQLKNVECQIKEMMVEKGFIEKDFSYSDIDKNILTHRVPYEFSQEI